jgi:peptide/nickel transport system permease protein
MPIDSTGYKLRRRTGRALKMLGSLAVTFLGLLAVTFFIGRVVPIDPVLAAVGDRASADTYAQVRREMGLDRPLYEQFFIYVAKAARGDFGNSVLTSNAVIDDIKRVFPATFELATLAAIIGVLFGVPAGVAAASRKGSWVDHGIRVVGLLGYSVPIFWLGLMGLLVFYAKLGIVAGPGRADLLYEGMVPTVTGALLIDSAIAGQWAAFRDAFAHVVLPASILGVFSMAYISRMTRSFMLEQLQAEYVNTARIKGLSERAVIWRHALGNAWVPLITVIALSYGNLLEGSILTESVFAWPGLGNYITSSLMSADMNAVLGGTVMVGIVFITLNFITDILYKRLDPRAR